MTSKANIHRDEFVQQLITKIEAGTLPWRSPYLNSTGFPRRHNGKSYRGINIFYLQIVGMMNEFTSPYWMTFKQAKELGGQVRKQQKSVARSFYYGTGRVQKADNDESSNGTYRFLQIYAVFNANQIDGLPEHYNPKPRVRDNTESEAARLALIELSKFPITTIIHDRPIAFYNPAKDFIKIPNPADMASEVEFISTFSHELAHSTGHESRLNRNFSFNKHSDDYSLEELTAELTANLFSIKYDFPITEMENHASYLGHWLRKLKNDSSYFFKAAAAAQEAFDYIENEINPQSDETLAEAA